MQVIKTAVILGYQCNNYCKFCYCADKREAAIPPLKTKEAKRVLEEGRARGSTFVDFLGGEPTIRNDLVELITYARELGYSDISITTNGRMLANKEYAKELIDAGLNQAIFSIHGHKPELHDYLVSTKGAFKQVTQGMKNMKMLKPDFFIATNTVMLKPNVKHLPKIAELCISLGSRSLEFIFPHPRGNAYRNFDKLVPHLEELILPIRKTIAVGIKHKVSHVMMRYVPMCYMFGCLGYLSEYVAKSTLKEQHIGPEFQDLNVEKGRATVGRIKGPQCFGCKHYKECEGIFVEYAEKRGFGELIPMP
jgi:MoaA/NifB/PqqE/SkfB family radical SAM enzyme